MSNGRVVDDPFGVAREVEELGRDVAKPGLALQVVPRHAVHFGGAGIDLALGIEVQVQRAPGGPAVDHLHRGELDDAMPLLGIETRRFGIEDDLAHAGRTGNGSAVILTAQRRARIIRARRTRNRRRRPAQRGHLQRR